MAKGEIPPTKERLDMALATQKTDSGVTMGVIKTLHKQVVNFMFLKLKIIKIKFRYRLKKMLTYHLLKKNGVH